MGLYEYKIDHPSSLYVVIKISIIKVKLMYAFRRWMCVKTKHIVQHVRIWFCLVKCFIEMDIIHLLDATNEN